MKINLLKIPVVGFVIQKIKRSRFKKKPFVDSKNYWVQRYEHGSHSGAGSYSHLAEFKAEILNAFVKENKVSKVIEYGCGDGNQLKLADYPDYKGFDVSPVAVGLCEKIFKDDPGKSFGLIDQYRGEKAQLTLSLDVIYHLVEDNVFESYMERLFDSAEQWVIIYSSDFEDNFDHPASHVRHRKFTEWIKANRPQWSLARHIPNKYPFKGDDRTGSNADFYVYKKTE